MKLNKKLIQQLRNGEISAFNNGTLEQLKEVLKTAFPEDKWITDGSSSYYLSTLCGSKWISGNKTNLPIKEISDFYQPELFTGWAKDDSYPGWMMYFRDDVPEFGFNVLGKWRAGIGLEVFMYSEYRSIRPATYEEIEKALIKEAKRRGYKKGNYKCLELPSYTHDVADVFYYNEKKNKLHHGEEGVATNVVFKDGQWAEIIEQPSQVKLKDKTNPIHYTVDGTEYSLDYQKLKFRYEDICQYSDEQFLDELPQIAHLACIISYFKGLGTQATISDKGIIHELIHLMTDPDEPTNDLAEIREKFNELIKLV